MECRGFHEFLRLKRRAIDMMAVRNRTGRNEMMRHSRNWVVFRRVEKRMRLRNSSWTPRHFTRQPNGLSERWHPSGACPAG